MRYATLMQEPAEAVHAPAEALAPADAHHLAWLESEAIHIPREVAGQSPYPPPRQNPAEAVPAPAEALAPADAHHLAWLESEAIHILREVAGQCRNPAL